MLQYLMPSSRHLNRYPASQATFAFEIDLTYVPVADGNDLPKKKTGLLQTGLSKKKTQQKK